MHQTSLKNKTSHSWSIAVTLIMAVIGTFGVGFPIEAQSSGTLTLTNSTASNSNIDAAVDSSGVTHAVYQRGGNIYYFKGSTGPEEIVDAPHTGITDNNPAIAIGPDNMPQVVFAANDGQYYTKRNATTGTWSAPVLFGDIPLGGYPDIAVGSNNAPQVVFAVDWDADSFSEIMYATGALTSSTIIWDGNTDSTSGVGSFFTNPHIALDSSGVYRLVAAHETKTPGTPAVSTYNILYFAANGATGVRFESPLRASAVGLSQSPMTISPGAGVAGGGSARVVYSQGGSAYSATLGTAWSETPMGAFTQLAISSDTNLVLGAYLSGANVNYTVDSGAGFGTGVQVDAGSNPVSVLNSNSISIYYLSNATVTQVMLKVLPFSLVPPVVVSNPTNQSVSAGVSAVFTAAATGIPSPTIQWQLFGTGVGAAWADIAGATTPSLVVANTTVSMTGFKYRAAFHNSQPAPNGTTVISSAATLTVTAAPPKVTPVITWPNPSDIIVGTALTATQLNATASPPNQPTVTLPGNFAYTLAPNNTPLNIGSVLPLGANQTINVTFMPTDTVAYNTATASVKINVTLPKPNIILTSSANPAPDASTQITLTATVSVTTGTQPTGTVTFKEGATTIGTGPISIVGSHAIVTVSYPAGTSHNITATYNGDAKYAAVTSVVLTQTVTAPPPPVGGGGGGGGGFGSQLIGINLSGTSPFMDGNGKSITAGTISTLDGKLTLTIPIGVFIWNAAGAAQPFLSATGVEVPPAPPEASKIIQAFEMGTNGVTFNPGISLSFNYSATDTLDLVENSLYIAWWDGSAWVKLTSTVDPTAKAVTANITHFTSFALVGLIKVAPPATTPPPTTTIPPSSTTPPTTASPTTDAAISTSVPISTSAPQPHAQQTSPNWSLIAGGSLAGILILTLVIIAAKRPKKNLN